MSSLDGVVRIVFATIALGMGVDFKNLEFTAMPLSLSKITFKRVVEIISSLCPECIGSQ